MKTNSLGIDLIKSFESLKLDAYLCPASVWTIGYGHTKGVEKGDTITEAEAIQFLKDDLHGFEVGVSTLVKTNLNENQFSALVSFAYNCGIKNLKNSTLLKKVNINPNDISIEKEFLRWTRARGVVLGGLVRRRKAEAKLYFKL